MHTRFPYALWFKIETTAIVIACLHHKRDTTLARERVAGVIEMGEEARGLTLSFSLLEKQQ